MDCCHLLKVKVKIAHLCPTLSDSVAYTVRRILQVRILEWVAFPSPRDLPNPGIEHCGQILYQLSHKGSHFLAIVNKAALNIVSFLGSSAGKESTCNAGDPGLIPGSGRSPGEGHDYPLQYSGTSLVDQTVKNMPAVQKIWVRSLSQKDPLEEGMATLSSILTWRIPMDRGTWQAAGCGVTKTWT